jgi:heme exporter protein D
LPERRREEQSDRFLEFVTLGCASVTYLPYIVAAYCVFGAVLAWDGLTPWLKYRRLLRAIRQKAVRASANRDRGDA